MIVKASQQYIAIAMHTVVPANAMDIARWRDEEMYTQEIR